MAAELSQQAVLGFLQSRGGSVKNSELLQHFGRFIRNHEERDRNRDIFKKFVNTVATVRQEDGVSYVVLRKKFRVQLQSGGGAGVSTGAPRAPAVRSSDLQPEKRHHPAVKASTVPVPVPAPAPAGEVASTTVLPAAGIITSHNNNNMGRVEVGVGRVAVVTPKTVVPREVPRTLEHPVQREWSVVGQQSLSFGPSPETTVEPPGVRHPEGIRKQQNAQVLVPETQLSRVAGFPVQEPSHQNTSAGAKVSPRGFRYRQSYKNAVSQDDDDDDEEEVEEATLRRASAGGVGSPRVPLEDTRRTMSASSPCISESPAPPSVASSSFSSSAEMTLPTIFIQNVEEEEETLRQHEPETSSESDVDVGQTFTSEESTVSSRRRRPSDLDHHSPSPHKANKELLLHHDVHQGHQRPQASGGQPHPGTRMTRLSSSHSSIFSPPSSSDGGFSSGNWPLSGSSRGSVWNSSCEDLQVPPGGSKILDVLQRSQRTKSATDLDQDKTFHHNQNPNVAAHSASMDHLHDNSDTDRSVSPWRLSTGEVNVDREDVESSEGSAASSHLRPLAVRRLNSQLRSRMCVSLGADLDQLLQEEARAGGAGMGGSEAARLNRLHLLSSSLSLRYNLSSSSLSSCSTPPRCQSLGNLVEGGDRGGDGGREGSLPTATTTGQEQEGCRKSLVPLEPKEHVWLVKAAAGAWPDIYSLFREEPSLLNKQDFISGFTVLHWIAKHGDHRVLNTLWYGVQKAGMMFDVNSRSTCGYTALHIAAIHGHKNIIRLLVNKFKADVKLRDVAGKKPWQYLTVPMSLDVFQLLGAPARAALGGANRTDSSGGWDQQQDHRRRRRRHHFSTASSGQRPLTVGDTIRVKRSSSIAALLKRKSLRRFHIHMSDSSV